MKLRPRPLVLSLGIALAMASIGAFSMTTEQQLIERAEQGDLDARLQLAEIYRQNEAETKAIEQLEIAAAAGNLTAMRLLGAHYTRQGDETTFRRGVEHYERAIATGDAGAKVDLGVVLSIRAMSPDIDRSERAGHAQRAARVLARPASEGHPEAAWHLGYLHAAGPSVMRNPDLALDLITKSADAGQPAAAYWVARHQEQIATTGRDLSFGIAVAPEARRAAGEKFIQYLETAASAGHVGAMLELAERYQSGRGVVASPEAARFWDGKAREHRGLIHRVTGSPDLAIAVAPPATTSIEPAPIPPSQTPLSTPAPPARATAPSLPTTGVSELAAAQEELRAVRERLAVAERRIADLIVERDAALARVDALSAQIDDLRRFHTASRNATELNRQGLALYQGRDYQGAERLFRIAAEGGDIAAMANLGLLHLRGHGVKQNTRKAIQLFKQASDSGNVVATENLAEIYARGLGVDEDPTRARGWYERALAQGSTNAQQALRDLDHRL